ncbi:ATP-binding protein [Mucilaginibacter panaciglaebae]|uniref:histidine kinase n=1 Tax=Mucilaginibacter panaciglaebae TaxID=502331 RepID=A0ABP7WTD9_9SPHI
MLSDTEIIHILTRSKDATAIYDDAELHIRFVNDAMLHIWGKDRSIIGKTLEEALPELKGQPFADLLKNVWATGETYQATDTPATLIINGEVKTSYFDFEFRALLNDTGHTAAILHTATDVTSRVLALKQVAEKQQREEQLVEELSVTNEGFLTANNNLLAVNHDLLISNESINRLISRLQESEEDFKRLMAQAPVAILVFRGPAMVIEMANAPMLEILNKDESVIGKPLLEGLPELKGEHAANLLFDVFNTGKPLDGSEVPVRLIRNGELEIRYFNFSYQPLRDENHVIGVMDVAVEVTAQVMARKNLESIITERTALEQNLRGNEQRLQGILDTMAEGVIIVDVDCAPIYANPMAQRIMGMSQQTFFDHKYNDMKWQNERVDGTPMPMDEHPIYVALKTGHSVYDQEIGIVTPSAEKIYISINAAPIINDRGQITGGIVTFTDVTNRRKILQQKDDFISVASHELKTPLASLKGALQLLDRMLPDISPEMLTKLVGQANKSLNKLTDLVNSLLNSNRISQGSFPIHKTTFNLKNMIDDCCQHIRSADTHTITLKGDAELSVCADEQLIDQVIVNLINNAVKYAPLSKKIVIKIERLDDHAKISVTDFGPGIPPDKLPHVFERYFRADYGSVKFSGLGLGLYICAEIIEKHGGRIGVHSNLRKGSTFWFTLPLDA